MHTQTCISFEPISPPLYTGVADQTVLSLPEKRRTACTSFSRLELASLVGSQHVQLRRRAAAQTLAARRYSVCLCVLVHPHTLLLFAPFKAVCVDAVHCVVLCCVVRLLRTRTEENDVQG